MRTSQAFVPAHRLLRSAVLGHQGSGNGLADFPRSIEDLFDRFSGAISGTPTARSWTPRADVTENELAYLVTLELPGVDPDEVEVTLDKDTLVVKGVKTGGERQEAPAPADAEAAEGDSTDDATEAPKVRRHRAEIERGAFERRFTFAVPVAVDGIEATANNGVLSINVAKAAAALPQRISVRRG